MHLSRQALGAAPLPAKALFSCFLITIGLGYLAAIYYLFTIEVDPHRKMGMTVIGGIEVKYRGQPSATRLEAALSGVMSGQVGAEDRQTIIGWLRGGATKEGFDSVRPILERRCVICHSAKSGLPIPPLTSYDEVRKVARVDGGLTLSQLARVSHIHLFGISLIFALTGGIFALSAVPARWKTLFVVLPFVSIWADIGSWWITKYEPVFAYIVLSGGALMGASLAVQIIIPLREMWLVPRAHAPAHGPPPT